MARFQMGCTEYSREQPLSLVCCSAFNPVKLGHCYSNVATALEQPALSDAPAQQMLAICSKMRSLLNLDRNLQMSTQVLSISLSVATKAVSLGSKLNILLHNKLS